MLGTASDMAIASELQVSVGSIHTIRTSLGIPSYFKLLRQKALESGLLGKVTDAELARTLNISDHVARSARQECGLSKAKRPGPKSVIRRRRKVLEMRRCGLRFSRIATEFGVTRQRAHQMYLAALRSAQ
jgi:DNA-directed RNA polymerase sigma subunit (sigma70/sigma32)